MIAFTSGTQDVVRCGQCMHDWPGRGSPHGP